MTIEPGMVGEKTHVVQETDTARMGGGVTLPPVFSTPRMISLMEQTAHSVVLPHLQEGQTSVGMAVNIRHLGATPVGVEVRFRAELLEVDGRRLRFKVEAWDPVEKIGEGEHERFIIDKDRFEARLDKKRQQLNGTIQER